MDIFLRSLLFIYVFGTGFCDPPSFWKKKVITFSEVSLTSVTATWRRWQEGRDAGTGHVIGYKILYRKKTEDARFLIINKHNDLQHTFSNLDPDTWYQFRIKIVGENGTEKKGSKIQLEKTLSCNEPEAVTKLTVSFREGDLSVTWKAPSSQNNTCNIDSYKVHYKLLKHEACNDEVIQNHTTVTTEDTESYLTGLESYATYEVSVYAVVTDESRRLHGPKATVTTITPKSVSTFTPTIDVNTDMSSSTSLVFTWEPIPCESLNAEFGYYLFTINTTTGRNGTMKGRKTSKEINQLLPCTLYEFTLRVVNDVEKGPIGRKIGRTKRERPGNDFKLKLQSNQPTSISARWTRPHHHPCGFKNQTISIQVLDSGGCSDVSPTKKSFVLSSGSRSYQFHNLIAYTRYNISIKAENTKGAGNVSFKEIKTGESYPPLLPKPESLFSNSSVIHIEWDIPDPPHGLILGYDILVQPANNLTSFSSKKVALNVTRLCEQPSAFVTSLQPNTFYSLKVRARTGIGPGNWSEPLNTITAEGKPGKPSDVQVKRRTYTTLTIDWNAPIKSYGNITKYEIRFRPVESEHENVLEGTEYFSNIIETSNQHKPFVHEITSLKPSTLYEIEISAYTSAGKGDTVILKESTQHMSGTGHGSAVWITVPLTLLALFIFVILIVLYRRGKIKKYNWPISYGRRASELAERRRENPVGANLEEASREEVELRTSPTNSRSSRHGIKPPVAAKPHKHFVRIRNLAAYVKSKKINELDNFVNEHESLPDSSLYPSDVALKPENKKKNRYGNIIPYDHSRVVLEQRDDDLHSDYINASFINGYSYQNKYIASHGPNKASVDDFWRMVWQEDVGKIVMLTNIKEAGKRKCEKYWPNETFPYGDIVVTPKGVNNYTYYIVRTFKLKKVDTRRTKIVKHFHFCAWPDMSVPDTARPILDLLQCVRSSESHSRGPTVVHCSAGVGRTGTFIALDAMLDMAAAEDRINVYQFVSQMRQNRMKMVQVAEQYEFIFDVLVEHFVIGDTSISVDRFRQFLSELKTPNRATGKTYLQEQFEKLDLTSITPAESKFRGGKDPNNLRKNRFPDCIPVDTYRPYLMTDVGDLGNNYINASFLSGFKRKNMFLGTQMTLENTVIDFWRMVWDYNSNVIIMLNDLDTQDGTQYWSDSNVFRTGPFTIIQLSYEDIFSIRCRQLKVTISSPKQSRIIQHIQCLNLRISATNNEISTVLLQIINNVRLDESGDDPITVHCINGVGRTGVFCSLLSSLDQAKTEGKVNVFQHVNKLRRSRPNMVETLDEYECIFDTVLMYLEQCDVYENLSR